MEIGKGMYFRAPKRRLLTKSVFCKKFRLLPHLRRPKLRGNFQMAKTHSFAVTGPTTGLARL